MNGEVIGMADLGETYDLVIVGSGAASICAALVAQDAGLKPVILEKMEKVGGSTGFSGGVLWVPDNPVMTRAGLKDDVTEARAYLNALVQHRGPASTESRREAFLDAAPRAIAFLEKRGMKFRLTDTPDYHDELPGGLGGGRSIMAQDYNLYDLRDWRDLLATYLPVRALPLGLDLVGKLALLKRTWGAKLIALKFGVAMALNKILPRREITSNGPALQGRLLEIALREGVPIFINKAVRGLVEENGRVVGVTIDDGGQSRTVRARRGVLLNAGGFAKSEVMRQSWQPYSGGGEWSAANPGDTGEVMQAAMKLGAATDCMDGAWWVATSKNLNGDWPGGSVMPDGTVIRPAHHLDLSLPFVILVAQNGRRIADESGSYVEIGASIYKRQRQSGDAIPCWAIFDRRHRDRYPWGMGQPGVTPNDWIESGYMKKAETLDELAFQCGIDPSGLKSEIERFNGFASTGEDLDFNRGGRRFDRSHGDPTVKPNPTLGPIETGPFYACAIFPGDGGTSGGLVTDEHGRVLRDDLSVIEGLYAAGNVTASVFGYSYPGAGASISAALAFGYAAARHLGQRNSD